MATLYLAVLTAYDIGAGSTTTLYYGTKGYTSGPSDTPANQYFKGRIERAPSLVRSAFRDGRTGGRTQTDFGTLVLTNVDGDLDDLIDYGFDGREIKVYRGEETGAFPADFEEVLVATMEQPEVDTSEVRIALRGRHMEVDVPIQSTLYAGTGTLEGDESLKGKPKPLLYGKVRNIAPPLVNPAKLIYQLNDGAVDSVDAVYDRGIPLGISLSEWDVTTGVTANTMAELRFGDGLFVGFNTTSLYTSPDAQTWTARTISGTGSSMKDLTYSADLDLWVLIGNGLLDTSPDAITWTARTNPFTGVGLGVDWSDDLGMFAAVSSDGELATSTDGITWTTRTSPLTLLSADSGAMHWGGGLFVCVINEITYGAYEIATSPDGITWTLRQSPFEGTATTEVGGLVYGHAGWVMAGREFATSPDGINWELPVNPVEQSIFWRGLHYFQQYGLYLAVTTFTVEDGATTRVLSSRDTVSWRQFDLDPSTRYNLFDISSSGSEIVVVGSDIGVTTRVAATPRHPGTYASQADLLDDTLAPVQGSYKVYKAGGLIRLGSPPDGQITADVTEGAAATDRTAAALFKGVLDQVGLDAFTNVQDEDDLTLWVDALGGITQTGGQSDPIGGTDAYSIEDTSSSFAALDHEITFTGDGVKSVIAVVKENVHPASGIAVVSVYDTTTTGVVWQFDIDSWTDGKPNYTETVGSVERLEDLGGGWWAVYGKTTSVTAANGHTVRIIPAQTGAETGTLDVYRIRCYDATDPLAEDYHWLDALRLDSDDNAVLGLWTGIEPMQAADALDRIARTPGAWWGVDRLGRFRFRQLQDPSSGTSELTIDEAGPNGIYRGTLRRLTDPLPIWRQVIRFSRNYTVQTSDIAGGVTDTRRALISKAWKEESDEDATVQTKHLLAREDVAETLYAESADASAEATRRLTLRKVIRDLYQFEAPLNDDTVLLDLGSIVTLKHSRYGLSAGKKHVVLGVEPNPRDGRLRLTAWA